MSIADRNLKPGTVLVARYKKKDYRCTVFETEDGKTVYKVHGGEDHSSPSAAGSAVMDGVACNGWRFWSVEGAEEPTKAKGKGKGKTKAKAKAEPKPKAEKKTKCGDCGQEFPNARKAADHMRDEHKSVEAAGTGS